MSLKDMIFKKEVTPVAVQPQKVFTPTTVSNGYVFSPNPTNLVTTLSDGVSDEKFIAILEQVIIDNNIPGLDYIEFKQAIEKMKNLPIDESAKILTTYSIFETQGCTKSVLLKSIDTYINLINKEQENFNAEMQASYNEKVAGKKAEIEKSQKEIENLTKKIVELNQFIELTSKETQAEEIKLKTADASFKQSAQKVISVLQSDKEKITTYIK